MEETSIESPVFGVGVKRRSTRLQSICPVRHESVNTSFASTPAPGSSRSSPAEKSSRSTPGDSSSRNTPQEKAEKRVKGPTPSKGTSLRRKRRESDLDLADAWEKRLTNYERSSRQCSSHNTPKKAIEEDNQDHKTSNSTRLRLKFAKRTEPVIDKMEAATEPLTDEERRSWPGWVELESEPTLFNYILRAYGVKDVKVQEVFGLEDEVLNFLPKPVYGLIFLFRYWNEDIEEAEVPSCPNHVWFANQTIKNACATIALLNIVMNVPKIDLGENLTAFKAETEGLKPPYRGQTLGENAFIRSIHNSFARRMDMLNADLSLSNDYDNWIRVKQTKKKKVPARKTPAMNIENNTKNKENHEEPGFHFIAYVPIDGNVWRLDGMQHQPVNLGEAGKNWIELARKNINIRIAQYDSELQFNLMALCRSPLRIVPEELAENLHSISAVEKALNAIFPDWKSFVVREEASPPLPIEPNESFALSNDLLVNSHASASIQRRMKAAADDPTVLIDMRIELLSEQIRLQKAYLEEITSIGIEDEQTALRKIDYTPIIYNSIKELIEKGVLKEILKDLIDQGQMKA